MRSFRSRQLFLLSIFTLFMFFSPIHSKFLDLGRRLKSSTAVNMTLDLKQYTIYDLEFTFTVPASETSDTLDINQVELEVSDTGFASDNIPLLFDLKTESGVHTIHVYNLITSASKYFTDTGEYEIFIDVGNQKYYKSTFLITMVDKIDSDISFYPFVNLNSGLFLLSYFENKFEMDVKNGEQQKATYAKVVKISADTTKKETVYEFKPLAALQNGHLTVENNFKNCRIVVITYDENKQINFISKKAFVTYKDPIQTDLKRNLYIKYNTEPHTFQATFTSLDGTDFIAAVTEAKFVSEDKKTNITLELYDFESPTKIFKTEMALTNLPTGIYYLYITMGGMEDVKLDKFIVIYDEFFDVFDKELSGVHTCNYIKSPQKYNLIYNSGVPLTTSESHMYLIQDNTNYKFEETFKKYNFPEDQLDELTTGEKILMFYEFTDNARQQHNYYRLNMTLTNFNFDCGDDLCGYCSNTNSENTTGHEVFENYDSDTKTYTSTLVLKDAICDPSELNFTFVKKSTRYTINPTCKYNNGKVTCSWTRVDSVCYGGNYEIYIEGIFAEYFNYYCHVGDSLCVEKPDEIIANEENRFGLYKESTEVIKNVEHVRLMTNNQSPNTCSKYYRRDFSHDSSSNIFYYEKERENSERIYLDIIPIKKVENQFKKTIYDDYRYNDEFPVCGSNTTCPAYPIAQNFTIPCENYIVLRKEQEITLKWEDADAYNAAKDKLYYYSKIPTSDDELDKNKLTCKDLDTSSLETVCTINTENVTEPRYLYVEVECAILVQKAKLITYTTNLDTCQELIPGKTLTDLVIELTYPDSDNSFTITPSFKVNGTTDIARTKDEHYTLKNNNVVNKFTFKIENNGNLKAGDYNVHFTYACGGKDNTYIFSKAKQQTNSYDADFTLRAYMNLVKVSEGNTLYTPEKNNQTLVIDVGSDLPEIPTLKFVNGKHVYKLDANFGTYDEVNKKLKYDVNLYEKRDELIRGTYEIYYISTCPNDPDVDTGLTVFLDYNILLEVDKKCIWSGDVNVKTYTLTYKYDFEVEWRQPKKIYGVYGTTVIDSGISAYNGNKVSTIINTNLIKEGNYTWAYEFNDTERLSSTIEIYGYLNKIQGHNSRYSKLLQTKNLTEYKVVLEKDIRDDQLKAVEFNYYEEEKKNLYDFKIVKGTKVNKYVQIKNNFTLYGHVGTANIRLEGVCYEEDGDYEDVPFEVIENCTLCTAIKDDMVFTRPLPAKMPGVNLIEIASQCYEIRELQKIRFERINKCEYPKRSSDYVYFCSESLIKAGETGCKEGQEIHFKKFGGVEEHYAYISVSIDTEFQYEYTIDNMYDSDETCPVPSKEREELSSTTTETDIVRIVDKIKTYTDSSTYHLFDGLSLRDYEDELSQYIYEYKNQMTTIKYTTNLLSVDAKTAILNQVTCNMNSTNPNCQASCVDSTKGNTYMDCTITFNSLTTNYDINVVYKQGTCRKLLYIVRADLDECSLVSDVKNIKMNLFTENELPEFNIHMSNEVISDNTKVGVNNAATQTDFQSYDKIIVSNYLLTQSKSEVDISSDLFSTQETTYYYFKFLYNDYNQFILTDAIIRKLGLVIDAFNSDTIYAQIFNDNLTFTFKSIFDKGEIQTFRILRENYYHCYPKNKLLDTHEYPLTESIKDLETSNLLINLNLINQIEFGDYYPHYITKHCPVEFTGTPKVPIYPPDFTITMTKDGITNTTEYCENCCKVKIVHHVGVESSTFIFTSNYKLHSYDIPKTITLTDKKTNTSLEYDVNEITDTTNEFSFTIPINQLINSALYTVTVEFPCFNKTFEMDDTIFIYQNDVIFSNDNRTENNSEVYFSEYYERQPFPTVFKFEKEIITEQLCSVKEYVATCEASSECNENGCPKEDKCNEYKERTLKLGEDYTFDGKQLTMKQYINKTFTKERHIIEITDKFCQTTKIGIKSKLNDPSNYEITYEKNVCPSMPKEVKIKFPCNNYDVNQIQKIIYKDETNTNYTLGKNDIEYNNNTYEIKFNLTVNKYVTLLSFIELSDTEYERSLEYEYNKEGNCLTKSTKEGGYTLASYTSDPDFFIIQEGMAKPAVEIKFLDDIHATDAKDKVNTKNNKGEQEDKLSCEKKTGSDDTLVCTYTPSITDPKRVFYYVDDKCNFTFDIISFERPKSSCQYYTKSLTNYEFVLGFDETIETYLNPNERYTISASIHHNKKSYSEELDLQNSVNVTYTYVYSFTKHYYDRYANFTFYITRNEKGDSSSSTKSFDELHHIIGYTAPYKIDGELAFNLQATSIVALIDYNREADEMEKINLYDKDGNNLLEFTDCATGSGDTFGGRFSCTGNLSSITETDYYYITIVDTCGYESPKKVVKLRIYATKNFLTNIQHDALTADNTLETTFTYKQTFNSASTLRPVSIELVHDSDLKSASEYGITTEMATIPTYDVNVITVTIKSNTTNIEIGEGLFRVKTTYIDDTYEISNAFIYVGKNALELDAYSTISNLGDRVPSVDIPFKDNDYQKEQIREVKLKSYSNTNPDSADSILPRVPFEKTATGITVNLTKIEYTDSNLTEDRTISVNEKGLLINQNFKLLIDDYFYESDLNYSLNYTPPENYSLVNEVFFIPNGYEEIEFTVGIELYTDTIVQDNLDQFWIKSCCNSNGWLKLNCTADSDNNKRILCPYKEQKSLLSQESYTIRYKEADAEIVQKTIYVNPSVISSQDYSEDIDDRWILYTKSDQNLVFYMKNNKGKNTRIKFRNATKCGDYNSYTITFFEVADSCGSQGLYEITAGLSNQKALERTYIRDFLCTAKVDISKIDTVLYSAKPGLQEFTVDLNGTVSENFMKSIIFKRSKFESQEFETTECIYPSDNTSSFTCKINLTEAVQGDYNVYYSHGVNQISKSELFPIKFIKNYREIVSFTPKFVYAYEDSSVILTFNTNFDYSLVNFINLIDKNNNETDTKIEFGDSLDNPVLYPIVIPKEKYTTGNYKFKVNFVESDDSFAHDKDSIFILEKQEFTPVDRIVLKDNGKVTLGIKHIKTTVNIKQIKLCGYTFNYDDTTKISTYSGEFNICDDLHPEFYIDEYDQPIKMDFEFVIIEHFTDIYKISAFDTCSYFKLDEYSISLTSISTNKLDLSTLTIKLTDGTNDLLFADTSSTSSEEYKQYKLTLNEGDNDKLLNSNWKLVILGDSSFKSEYYSLDVKFTDLKIPEYVMRGDTVVEFTDAKCQLSVPFEFTFKKEETQKTIKFTAATLTDNKLTMTLDTRIPKFDEYGMYEFYLDGASNSLGSLFVSNTLDDSSFTVEASTSDFTQSLITVKSVDYYCKLITEFDINKLGYTKYSEFISINEAWTNNKIVEKEEDLSFPATKNLAFIVDLTNITYKHDLYNYQFEITRIQDKTSKVRNFYNKYLYYEGPEYQENIKILSSILFISANTEKEDTIYIPLEIINNGEATYVNIDGDYTHCIDLETEDYSTYNLQQNNDTKYVKCAYTYNGVKELTLSYKNNPCFSTTLYLATYSFGDTSCLTIGQEDLSNEVVLFTIVTPRIEKMKDITTMIGQYSADKKEIVEADSLTYTLIFTYNTIQESTNYNYQILLNNDDKEAITIVPSADEALKLYKYVDIESIDGIVEKTSLKEFTVNLYKPIRKEDLPLYFELTAINTNDHFISFNFKLDTDVYKKITVNFTLNDVTDTEYQFSYVNPCSKIETYSKHIHTKQNTNSLYSVKFVVESGDLSLTYNQPITTNTPNSITLQKSDGTEAKHTYTLKTKSSKNVNVTITDNLVGLYNITTNYDDGSVLENKQIYLNGFKTIGFVDTGTNVKNGYNVDWYELKLNGTAYDDLFIIGYQKYTTDASGEETIADISELTYVIEPTATNTIRFKTSNIIFKYGYNYRFYLQDRATRQMDYYEITVDEGEVEFTFDKHFYKYEDVKDNGITFKATTNGVTFGSIYVELTTKLYYYYEPTSKGNNQYTYTPKNPGEVITIYYNTTKDSELKQVGEKLYVYTDISEYITVDEATCVYAPNKQFNLNLEINSNLQTAFLSYKMGDSEISGTNAIYSFSEYTNTPTTFNVYDNENTVIFTKDYTFTDLEIISETATIEDDSTLSFEIKAQCLVEGLTIKIGNDEYTMTCNLTDSTNNKYKCTSEAISDTGKIQTITIYSKGEQVKSLKVYSSFSKATITMTKPLIIYPATATTIKLSSTNYDMSKINGIEFTYDNGTKYTYTKGTDFNEPENNEIKFDITLQTKKDKLNITKFTLDTGSSVTVSKFRFIASTFGITTDQFFLINDKKLKIQVVGTSTGEVEIASAQTDKGLKFNGNKCKYNSDCELELNTESDYTGKLGESVLTVYYGEDSLDANTNIYIRVTDPIVNKMTINENPNTFEATFDQSIYTQYITKGKVYFKIESPTSEFKCTSTAYNTEKVDVTCPISYVDGFTVYAYIFGQKQKLSITYTSCTEPKVLNDGQCVECKEKNSEKPLYYDGKCYSKCPGKTYKFKYDNKCYETCPTNYTIIQEGECVEQCSDGFGLLSSLQTECKNCSLYGLILHDGYCVKDCPKGLKYDNSTKKCKYVVKITVSELAKYQGYCNNDGSAYFDTVTETLKCNCTTKTGRKYYGATCSYDGEEEAKVENDKLSLSIFATGKIGSDGKIQDIVPFNYNSEELLTNIADLIDGLRNDTFNPDANFTQRIITATMNLVNEVMEKLDTDRLYDKSLATNNVLAILTLSIQIDLKNGALRRLLGENAESLNNFIALMKKFVANTNTLENGELSAIEPNSFGLFNVKTYKNTEASKNDVLNKTTAEKDTAKLAYITLNNCNGVEIPDDANYHLLESTDPNITLKGIDGLSIDGVDSENLSKCKPTYAYKTECSTEGGTIGGSTSEYSYITTENENKGVNFQDANDEFFNTICYRVPDAFEYDITYKTRASLYPNGISIEEGDSSKCTPQSSSVKCGDPLIYECESDANPKNNVTITPAAPTEVDTDYNLVTKCAKDATKLGKNTAFVVYLVFVLLLFVSGIVYVVIDLLHLFQVEDDKKLEVDSNTYLNSPGNVDGQSEVKVKGADDIGNTANGNGSFCDIFRNNILKLHPLTSHFFLSMINPIWLKLVFFFCEMLMLFGFNAILFKSDYIDTRMTESSRNNFGYPLAHEFTRVICSIIIVAAITVVCRAVSFVTEGHIKLLLEGGGNKDNFATFKRNLLPRRIATTLILLAIVAVSWYYATAFCYIYHKTQKGWICGGIWSLLFNWIIFAPLYICLISAIEKNNPFAANVMKKLFIF